MSLMGYIKLDRKITEWEWFTDGNMLKVWVYLLAHANFKESRYKGYEIGRGDVIVGRRILAQRLKLTENQVRTCLEKLKKTQEITIKTTNKFSIISIVKWAEYQCLDDDDNQQQPTQITNKSPTNHQQTTTLEERKNVRKKEKNIYIGKSDEFVDAFEGYAEMRKQIKKPLTDRAKQMVINKLDKLSSNEKTQIAILNQSTVNCWQGVFELRDKADVPAKERYVMDF